MTKIIGCKECLREKGYGHASDCSFNKYMRSIPVNQAVVNELIVNLLHSLIQHQDTIITIALTPAIEDLYARLKPKIVCMCCGKE